MSTHAAYVRQEETRLEAAAAKLARDNIEDADELLVLESGLTCRACKAVFAATVSRIKHGQLLWRPEILYDAPLWHRKKKVGITTAC